MDLRVYYKKIKDLEQSLPEPSVVVVSHETPDGGRQGVRTEVPPRIGAKLVIEGRARLATDEEASEFREQQAEAKRKADQLAAGARMKFTVVPASELRNFKGGGRTGGE
jgi:hypothetical protein